MVNLMYYLPLWLWEWLDPTLQWAPTCLNQLPFNIPEQLCSHKWLDFLVDDNDCDA